ncbi:MAG: bifunctional phosphopantothenoylcysteine decarboxylase/phosphopantothenate--cysteine ligase CoaBC [Anaerovoracaceae bacterium]|jgi:phosphopantothenoylcysteine decarboxylase/phosphopantothenate--cysteine ligase
MLKGKTVLLGVTGSIAAYKAAALASLLVKQHCDVHVLMTPNATEFISPLTFETLTNNKVPVDTFDRNFQYNTEHIALAKRADLVVVAPATANAAAKLANGIADDMLTTTVLACRCKKILAPAMNTAMYENPVTQENLNKLRDFGWEVVSPASGWLACGDIGVGKMPEPELLLEVILMELAHEKDMKGLNVLVTAGPTIEAIDPVRYITNHSSGKMGYAIAKAASQRGARVTLVSGKTSLTPPLYMDVINVMSAQDMFEAVTSRSDDQDIIIKAAAVADYRPVEIATEKIKKGGEDPAISLAPTVDILKYLGEHRREGQFLCGFSMETQNLVENSRKKLMAKKVDMIACNNLKEEGAGFAVDTNRITLITADDEIQLPLLTKEEAANRILDAIMTHRGK